MGTRWRPNTCGCELDFIAGPTQPPVHLTRCPEHLADDGLTVWDENRGLNRTLKVLQEAGGIAPETVTWTFTRMGPRGRRSLEIALPGAVGVLAGLLDPSDLAHVHLRSTSAPAAPHARSPSGEPT